MATMIIENISKSCGCTAEQAHEYLNDELCNLRELSEGDDLRYDDFETACGNLGLENDYIEYFINRLAMA